MVRSAARFLPSVVRAGPGSAAKRLTHLWNNFSSIWKEHMLFLLREERVLSRFAETWRKRQTLAWPQHLISSNVLCALRGRAAGLCSQVQGGAQVTLAQTSALGHSAGPSRRAGCLPLILFLFHRPVFRTHNPDGLKVTEVLLSDSSGGPMSVIMVSAGPQSLCRHRGRVCSLPFVASGSCWHSRVFHSVWKHLSRLCLHLHVRSLLLCV